MAKMCFCDNCGRSIDGTYVFCPWCGKSTVETNNQASKEILAENIEENNRRRKLARLENMEKQLDELEKELSVIVLSSEMAR